MKELNEKLAKWAGFELIGEFANEWWTWHGMEVYGRRWTLPDKSGLYVEEPDFTSDITACFKWLVPKLMSLGWKRYCEIMMEWAQDFIPNNKDPALSLCLAIEKLIEAENES